MFLNPGIGAVGLDSPPATLAGALAGISNSGTSSPDVLGTFPSVRSPVNVRSGSPIDGVPAFDLRDMMDGRNEWHNIQLVIRLALRDLAGKLDSDRGAIDRIHSMGQTTAADVASLSLACQHLQKELATKANTAEISELKAFVLTKVKEATTTATTKATSGMEEIRYELEEKLVDGLRKVKVEMERTVSEAVEELREQLQAAERRTSQLGDTASRREEAAQSAHRKLERQLAEVVQVQEMQVQVQVQIGDKLDAHLAAMKRELEQISGEWERRQAALREEMSMNMEQTLQQLGEGKASVQGLEEDIKTALKEVEVETVAIKQYEEEMNQMQQKIERLGQTLIRGLDTSNLELNRVLQRTNQVCDDHSAELGMIRKVLDGNAALIDDHSEKLREMAIRLYSKVSDQVLWPRDAIGDS